MIHFENEFCVCLCFGMHYSVSILVLLILKRKGKLDALHLMSYRCNVTINVALSRSAMGCSAVCDCGIS